MNLFDELRQQDLMSDPADPQSVAKRRAEVLEVVTRMRESRGELRASPPMLFTAISAATKRHDSLNPQQVLVVSVGGSNTHWRAYQIETHHVARLPDGGLLTHLPTPGSETAGIQTLEDMLGVIATTTLKWLEVHKGIGHIVLNWGFPSQPFAVEPALGLSDAYAGRLTKRHVDIDAEGQRIGTCFRKLLNGTSLPITVQNDTVLSAQRYLAKDFQQYHRVLCMVAGTGVNIALCAPYFVERDGKSVVYDGDGVPLRADSEGRGQTRDFWVNTELGQTQLAHYSEIEHAAFYESALLPTVENHGAAGSAFSRIFANLIERFILDGQKVFIELAGVNGRIAAREIAAIAADASHLQALPYSPAVRDKLHLLANVVIHRCQWRLAQLLSAACLFAQHGLRPDQAKDAIALEGSLWKIPGLREGVADYVELLLQPELSERGMTSLNADLVAIDDLNASAVGPAYLIGLHT